MTRALTDFGLHAIIATKALGLDEHVVVEWDDTLRREEYLFRSADGTVVYKATLVGDGKGSESGLALPPWSHEWDAAADLMEELVELGWRIEIAGERQEWAVRADTPGGGEGVAIHARGPAALALAVATAAAQEEFEIREPVGVLGATEPAKVEPAALRGEAGR